MKEQNGSVSVDDTGGHPATAGQVEHTCGRKGGLDHTGTDPAERTHEPQPPAEIGLRTHVKSFAREANPAYETVVTLIWGLSTGSARNGV
ncbi:hypothetical protein Airi02_089500 [Actinoallomurus iriomotensis]|uniref:Uncharacterized protein n=1 Tax=Actinoallomurus iriomotensis TaxID=478107 RepID=A0A9W6SCC6_9ACTN|nr:hypothetical protein Airi02_089500 [Actinoallomurus iriomotensis]